MARGDGIPELNRPDQARISNANVFSHAVMCPRMFSRSGLEEMMPVEKGPVSEQDRHDIEGALGGEDRAYERLVKRYEQDVASWMWRFTRDRNDLEELVQEAFIQAYFSLPRFRGEASFKTWLLSIATRVGTGYWKRKARDKARDKILPEWAMMQGEEALPSPHEASDLLHGLLGQLQSKDRLILTLMYWEEMSTREIAQLTGTSHSLVKVRALRARRRLRRLLQDSEGLGKENG